MWVNIYTFECVSVFAGRSTFASVEEQKFKYRKTIQFIWKIVAKLRKSFKMNSFSFSLLIEYMRWRRIGFRCIYHLVWIRFHNFQARNLSIIFLYFLYYMVGSVSLSFCVWMYCVHESLFLDCNVFFFAVPVRLIRSLIQTRLEYFLENNSRKTTQNIV